MSNTAGGARAVRPAAKAADVLETIAAHAVHTVDLRYSVAGGAWCSAGVPSERLDANALLAGIALEPGALLVPDLDSAYLDGQRAAPTLVLICDLVEPGDEDPRRLAKRAEARLSASGIADSLQIAAELRYYVFDAIGYENAPDATGYRIEAGSTGELDALRAEILVALRANGIEVAVQRAIARSPAQTALELRPRSLLRAADALLCAKHTVRAVVERRGKSATFMPKPLAGSPGSALRVGLSLLKDGKSPFFDKDGWACASQTLLFFVGGLLTHADSLLALCAPSANSYTRLAAAEQPLLVAFGPSHAATAVAVDPPGRPEAKHPRIDFRPPDASANPYLAFAALLCAGLDGVERRIDPISAGFGPLEAAVPRGRTAAAKLRRLAPTLGAALDAFAADHAYLTAGDVFGDAFIRRWSEARRAREVIPLEARPHPFEYELSYDC